VLGTITLRKPHNAWQSGNDQQGGYVSIEAMIDVIERVESDAEFRLQLRTNPDAVLVNYELSTPELAALKSGDRRALLALGLPGDYVARPLRLWRGKDEAGSPGNALNPQRVDRPSTTEAGVARR
jgi:hypothetical protein